MAGFLFSDGSNFVDSQAGSNSEVSSSSIASTGDLPWGNKAQTPSFRSQFTEGESFFAPYFIDYDRWNKFYPYRLLVVDVSKGNEIVGDPELLGSIITSSDEVYGNGGIEYVWSQNIIKGSWECTLPISPQQLNIDDMFAINTSATMRGIIEEHNGIKFKMITAAGTTGIWPRKPTKEGSLKSVSNLGSIFSGTISAASNLADSASRVSNMFSGSHPANAMNTQKPEETSATIFSTGYYQALYLAQFLERYAQAKKKPENKNWRLVFDIPKQNQSFVVTPINFRLSQSHQKTNEILFNMQFKAWKRIEIQQFVDSAGNRLPELESNLFQRMAGTIDEVRNTLASATNLIQSVKGDFQRFYNIIRQTALIVKDLGNLAFTVADLPRNIIKDLRSSIEESVDIYKNAFERPVSIGGSGRTANSNGNPSRAIGDAVNDIKKRQARFEGVIPNINDIGSIDSLNSDLANELKVDSLNNIFSLPEFYYDFFSEIPMDSVNLTLEQEELFEDELENVRLSTIQDLRDFKNEILELALDISNNFGAGDGVYSSIYGRPDPRERVVGMTIEENEILAALYEFINIYDLLSSTKQFDDLKIESPLEYVGGIANESGINFEQFSSKMLVPVPFGLGIEEVAARYMGNPDKWLEIATINGLRSPYIDEEGFYFELLTNAEGRQFTIYDPENRLFLGQNIILKSNTVPSFSRKIIDIEEINNSNYLITVDGESNLDSLKTLDSATMQGYLPGTVNSQNQIYIPVNQPSEDDDRAFEIPNLGDKNLTKVSKIDFLLTDDGDIALNALGDFRLANGLTNLIQALKIKIRTEKGTLLRHLDFGLGISHGVSVADIESGEIIKSMNKMISNDSRFEGIERFTIRLVGSSLFIDMAVTIANKSGVVPLTFKVDV